MVVVFVVVLRTPATPRSLVSRANRVRFKCRTRRRVCGLVDEPAHDTREHTSSSCATCSTGRLSARAHLTYTLVVIVPGAVVRYSFVLVSVFG